MDDATRATWLFSMKSKSIVRLLFQSFYTMVATQFGQNIKSIELIMPKSLTCLISLIPIVLYTNIAVFILHNKILLWRENTSTFFPLQGHYRFSLKFLFNFRVILFWLLPISLIDFLFLCCMIKHLLSFCFIRHQITIISKFLAIYALLLLLLKPGPNSH